MPPYLAKLELVYLASEKSTNFLDLIRGMDMNTAEGIADEFIRQSYSAATKIFGRESIVPWEEYKKNFGATKEYIVDNLTK